jgi:hypothetical protein
MRCLSQRNKLLKRYICESIVCKDLTEQRPALTYAIVSIYRVCRHTQFAMYSQYPHFSEALANLGGQWTASIGVDRFKRLERPNPNRRKIKPPHFAILLKRKVLKRMLARRICIRNKFLTVSDLFPRQNSGTRKTQNAKNKPPPG